MDPNSAFLDWLHNGHHAVTARQSAANYNNHIAHGGFTVRAELHPASDAWMQGDRFGEVLKLGYKFATVKMDRSGQIRRVSRDLLLEVR